MTTRLLAMRVPPAASLPECGLALLSAIALARAADRELVVRWEQTSYHIGYLQIWEPSTAFSIVSAEEWADYTGSRFQPGTEAAVLQSDAPVVRILPRGAFCTDLPRTDPATLLRLRLGLRERVDAVAVQYHLDELAGLCLVGDTATVQACIDHADEVTDYTRFIVFAEALRPKILAKRALHERFVAVPRATYSPRTTRAAHSNIVDCYVLSRTARVYGSPTAYLSFIAALNPAQQAPVIISPQIT